MSVNTQILQALNETILNESSLSRVISHIRGRSFCLITSFRAKNEKGEVISREDNLKTNKELAKDLSNLKIGFFKVNGKFIQSDHKDSEPIWVSEDSYFVVGPNLKDKEACDIFKNEMVKLCGKYNQQSIIIGTPEGVFEFDKTGNKLTNYKTKPTIITDKDAEKFMTQLIGKGQRAFKFQINNIESQNL